MVMKASIYMKASIKLTAVVTSALVLQAAAYLALSTGTANAQIPGGPQVGFEPAEVLAEPKPSGKTCTAYVTSPGSITPPEVIWKMTCGVTYSDGSFEQTIIDCTVGGKNDEALCAVACFIHSGCPDSLYPTL